MRIQLFVVRERSGYWEVRLDGRIKSGEPTQMAALHYAEALAQADMTNVDARRDLTVAIQKVGDVDMDRGDASKALAGYQRMLDLTRAIAPYHLTELDVHDVLNIFQVTGLDPVHEIYFMETSPARPGDFLEFFAEIDLLCAISTCPSGNLSVWGWGEEGGNPLDTCKPIGIEVFELPPALLTGWQSPQPVKLQSVYDQIS